ncbi:MAG: hypothetical protein ABI591_14775 [Kofleriaceae bacterium]
MWLTSLDPEAVADRDHLLASLGKLYERGISPNWAGFYHDQDRAAVVPVRAPALLAGRLNRFT